MKRCPQCNRVETDEALKFCRVDGAPLLEDASSVNREAGTIHLGSSPSTETDTNILPHNSGLGMNRVTTPTTILSGQSSPANTRHLGTSTRKELSSQSS